MRVWSAKTPSPAGKVAKGAVPPRAAPHRATRELRSSDRPTPAGPNLTAAQRRRGRKKMRPVDGKAGEEIAGYSTSSTK
jgi:hypothetical protein